MPSPSASSEISGDLEASYDDDEGNVTRFTLLFARSKADPSSSPFIVGRFGSKGTEEVPKGLHLVPSFDPESMKEVQFTDYPANFEEKDIGGLPLWSAVYKFASDLEASELEEKTTTAMALGLQYLGESLEEQSTRHYEKRLLSRLGTDAPEYKDYISLPTQEGCHVNREMSAVFQAEFKTYVLQGMIDNRLFRLQGKEFWANESKSGARSAMVNLAKTLRVDRQDSQVLSKFPLREGFDIKNAIEGLPEIDSLQNGVNHTLRGDLAPQCEVVVQIDDDATDDTTGKGKMVVNLKYEWTTPDGLEDSVPDLVYSSGFINAEPPEGYKHIPIGSLKDPELLSSLEQDFDKACLAAKEKIKDAIDTMFEEQETVEGVLTAIDEAVSLAGELIAMDHASSAVDDAMRKVPNTSQSNVS